MDARHTHSGPDTWGQPAMKNGEVQRSFVPNTHDICSSAPGESDEQINRKKWE